MNKSMKKLGMAVCVSCCVAAFSWAGTDVAYVDVDAPAGNQPPFDSPEHASRSIAAAIETLSSGGKVVFAPNQIWTLESSFSVGGEFSLVGPEDRSTAIVGGDMTVNAGQRFENLIFSNSVVSVKTGGVLSNCFIRCGVGAGVDGRALKVCGGLAADSTIEDFKGVGVLMDRNVESMLVRCVVRGGRVEDDGWQLAIVSVLPGARAVLRDCVVADNVTRCVAHGGTLGYLHKDAYGFASNYKYDLVLDRCIVSNNQGRAAVMRLGRSGDLNLALADSPRVYATNCLFAANKSIQVGESVANRLFMCRGEFVNCTIAENETTAQMELFNLMNDGAGCPKNAAVAKFVNTVVSGNACAATYMGKYGDLAAWRCVFPEATTEKYADAGNFAGPAVFRGEGETPYALDASSPGYGTGDSFIWTKNDLDLAGEPRLNTNGRVDMGCYKSDPSSDPPVPVAYVDATAPAGNQPPFDSPDRASRSIAAAIETLSPGGKVVFAPNQTWTLETSFSFGGDFSLVGPGDRSTAIVGGDVAVNARQRFANLVFSNNVVTVKALGVLSNCAVRCGVGERSVGRALVVRGGLAADTTIEDFKGVGVFMDKDVESTLERCVVRGGRVEDETGCQYAIVSVLPGARAVLRDCVVADNVTSCVAHGGTLGYFYKDGCGYDSPQYGFSLVLDRCVVSNNRGRMPVMRLCNSDNVAFADFPRVYATNCLFAANKSIKVGSSGENRLFMCRGEFVNCTIAENETTAQLELFNLMNTGTGCPRNADVAKFVNTVVSDNACAATYMVKFGDVNARNSIFPEAGAGNYAAAGNLAGPAVFRGKGIAPHALKTRSPGCGAGDASIWTKGDFDLAGRPRLNKDGTVDMGCYASRRPSGMAFMAW